MFYIYLHIYIYIRFTNIKFLGGSFLKAGRVAKNVSTESSKVKKMERQFINTCKTFSFLRTSVTKEKLNCLCDASDSKRVSPFLLLYVSQRAALRNYGKRHLSKKSTTK